VAESTLVTPSTVLATTIVRALVAAGVREVVLCPGSRSSALAYAVAAAERAGDLRLHVRVDERSAGFLALGLAKVSRCPAVVITTSGTAVANLHPAVLEAHHARVPLVVLSADRPAELRGTGANQTTLQSGLFAGAVRDEADLAPETAAADLVGRVTGAVAAARGLPAVAGARGLPGAVADARGFPGAVAEARGLPAANLAGPAHLNVQFREPLVPDLADLGLATPAPSLRPDPPGRSLSQPEPAAQPATGVDLPARTLVVLGDLPTLDDARAVLDWADLQGLPVVAEPFGPHPRAGVVRHGVLVVGVEGFVSAHEPEALVLVGRPTLSRPISRLLRRPGPALFVVDAGLELDVPGRASTRLSYASLRASTVGGDASSWRAAWLGAGEQVAAAIDAAPPAWGTGPGVARVLARSFPAGALVFLGSSNTPRDLDIAATVGAPLDLVASRGLAGIDGCVSTAVGLALAAPGRPAHAVLGDLTFLHDSGGLLIGPEEHRPDLTIVVANDDGGGIFATLEPGEPERAADFERLFGTPTGTDLAALCRAHGVGHTEAATPEALTAALAAPPGGLRVVEVPVDRSTHRAERERLRRLAAEVLS
jgi:2-succinyl-5-enolpyruvyl-6-hydroxy-3-cyclohexene-1-carboxylate synthase